MATTQEGLKHRTTEGVTAPPPSATASRDPKKVARAKRGVRSLAVAVALSAALTLASFYFSGGPASKAAPSVAVIRAGTVVAAAVMALAAWMVWAEGGFHRRPAALAPFLAHLAAALAWPPLVLGMGSTWAGMAACAAMAAGAVACARAFGGVNPVAGDLVKPCVAWAVLLAVLNYKMM